MKLTVIGSDYIVINEDNLRDENILKIPRVHLIELAFQDPTKEKIEAVLTLYSKTNRFVISDNIRIYNALLKQTAKKYYVKNTAGVGLISFFRKNNKVLLDTIVLSEQEKSFVLDTLLPDILRNIEVIRVSKSDFEKYKAKLEPWNGNVIVV
ncbi:MAG TPA: hypothetical protein P5293_01320 [Bacteroidales bacterium]|nr:hypothetical protein [Bacteroidales bacterium]